MEELCFSKKECDEVICSRQFRKDAQRKGQLPLKQQSFVAPSDVAIPADWKDVRSHKNLRIQSWLQQVGTWDHFDVKEAYQSWSRDAPASTQIPSVKDLRAHGYFLHFFQQCMNLELERHRLLDILRQPDTALAQYLVQHHAFWQEPQNANRIDEIQEHFEGMTLENFRREATPCALLARLARERAASRKEELSDDPFPCLKLIDPCVYYEEGDFTVEVITTSRQLSRASCELKNCAEDYLPVAQAGHTVLLVLKQAGKLVGMAEWENAEGKFMQLVKHCNEPIRAEWGDIFDRAERCLPKQLVIVCSDQQLTPPFYLPPSCLEIWNIQLHKVVTPIKLPLENILNMSPRQSHQMTTPALRAWASLVDALSQYDWETLRTAESLIELAYLNDDKKLFGPLLEIRDHRSWWLWAIDRGSLQTVKALARLVVISMEREGPEMLLKAIEGDHLEIARWLIEAGTNVNAKFKPNNFHETPFLMAANLRQMTFSSLKRATQHDQEERLVAAQGSLQMLQCMIEAGADVNADLDGRTVLHEALGQRDYEFANVLIDSGANVNLMCFELQPLHMAFMNLDLSNQEDDMNIERIEIAEKLIAFSANVNAVNRDGNMPLHLAVAHHMPVRILQSLVKAGADVTAVNSAGNTPFYIALRGPLLYTTTRNLPTLDFLIQSGADATEVNAVAEDGKTQLHAAAEGCDLGFAKWLIDLRADVNAVDKAGNTPLHDILWHVVEGAGFDFANLLIESGADANAVNKQGESPLYNILQCIDWDGESVDRFFRRVDLNAVNKYGRSPLHMVVYKPRLARALVQAGADVHAVDKNGRTPLHEAADEHSLEYAKLLIESDADVNAVDMQGKTPLHQGAYYCRVEMSKFLIQCGADIGAMDKYGKTPLHTAVAERTLSYDYSTDKAEMVKLLINFGADLNAVDNDGKTPYDMAALQSNTDIALLLEEAADNASNDQD